MMEENRVLTIPKEQYEIINNRHVLHYTCPYYCICEFGKDKGNIKKSDTDLELNYTLLDLSNHEIISKQLISLIPKISVKAVDELCNDIDKLMKSELEIINVVENSWKNNVFNVFVENAKKIPKHNQDKYIEEFREKMKDPIRENIESLYKKIRHEPKVLEYIVEFRFRKYGNRCRVIQTENINEINKKILRKIQNQIYYEKNKNKAAMTHQEIEEHMKFLKTKSSAWRHKEIICQCGSKFLQANKARHEKTSIVHLKYLQKKELETENEDEEED